MVTTQKVSRNASIKNLAPIVLLKPKAIKDKTVFKAIQQRQTIREISDKKIPLQTLSNLLWAACGVNRKSGPFGNPGRTSATASSSQEIDIYVALKEGIYLYDAFLHKLIPVIAGDHRKLAIGKGQLSLGDKAPVRLIYVADIDKLANTKGFHEPGLQNPEVQKSYYFVDTGIIAGNIYLFAASQGLASWFHNCNKQELAPLLKLRKDQRVIFGHTIGYPLRKNKLIIQTK
jgi:SagB-type dehydrogenase family enzyme